jgi:hypothetical protein
MTSSTFLQHGKIDQVSVPELLHLASGDPAIVMYIKEQYMQQETQRVDKLQIAQLAPLVTQLGCLEKLRQMVKETYTTQMTTGNILTPIARDMDPSLVAQIRQRRLLIETDHLRQQSDIGMYNIALRLKLPNCLLPRADLHTAIVQQLTHVKTQANQCTNACYQAMTILAQHDFASSPLGVITLRRFGPRYPKSLEAFAQLKALIVQWHELGFYETYDYCKTRDNHAVRCVGLFETMYECAVGIHQQSTMCLDLLTEMLQMVYGPDCDISTLVAPDAKNVQITVF